jgi:hypothetical protein
MNKVRSTITVAICTVALSTIFSTSAAGVMKKCVGPNGDVRFTNLECPEGYVLEASRAASPPSTSSDEDEPYICRFSSILTSTEIVSAVTEAEGSLELAREKGDDEAARYWQNCLKQIQQRETALQSPAPPPAAEESAPAGCSEGTFEYKEGGMYFTSSTRSPCTGVKAVCTFEVRESQRVTTNKRGVVQNRRREGYTTTTGERVRNFDYQGQVGKWGTAKIGDVNISGRVTGWNCLFEK